jgi:hypothetical protein
MQLPTTVAVRSSGLLLPGVVISNPVGGINASPFRVLCVVGQRSLRMSDHLSRGLLPTVVCPVVFA